MFNNINLFKVGLQVWAQIWILYVFTEDELSEYVFILDIPVEEEAQGGRRFADPSLWYPECYCIKASHFKPCFLITWIRAAQSDCL